LHLWRPGSSDASDYTVTNHLNASKPE
jgi:hypothetical protein